MAGSEITVTRSSRIQWMSTREELSQQVSLLRRQLDLNQELFEREVQEHANHLKALDDVETKLKAEEGRADRFELLYRESQKQHAPDVSLENSSIAQCKLDEAPQVPDKEHERDGVPDLLSLEEEYSAGQEDYFTLEGNLGEAPNHADLTKKLDDANIQIEQISFALENEKKKHRETLARLDALSSETATNLSQLQTEIERNEDLKRELSATKERLTIIEKQKSGDVSRTKIAHLTVQLEALSHELEMERRGLLLAKSKRENDSASLADDLVGERRNHQQAMSQISDLEVSLASERQRYEQAESRNNDLLQELNSLKASFCEEKQSHEDIIHRLQLATEKAESVYFALEQSLTSERKEHEQAKSRNEEVSGELQVLQASLERNSDEAKSRALEYAAVDGDDRISQLIERNVQLNEEVAMLQRTLSETHKLRDTDDDSWW